MAPNLPLQPLHRSLLPLTLLLLLSGCSSALINPLGNKQPGTSLDTSSSGAGFNFPMASCGDESASLSSTWYVVYINKANLEEIRDRYCQDAMSTIREQTGEPAIQVASFTTLEKATKFAQDVGGEVETISSSGATPATAGGPSSDANSTSASLAPGGSGSLRASDPGSPINIRSSAAVSAEVQEIGYSGDRVQIVETTQAEGTTWYRVRLDSGLEGWVRGDLVSAGAATAADSSSTVAAVPPESRTSNRSSDRSIDSTISSAADSATVDSPDRPSSPSAHGQSGQSVDPTSLDPTHSDSTDTSPTYSNPGSSGNTQARSTEPSSSSLSSGRAATLTAEDTDATINIRASAGTASEIEEVGYAGDRVEIAEKVQGDDGYTWYRVRLESGTDGWVRGDFVGGN